MANTQSLIRFAAVTIICTDLARSIEFYHRVLGAIPQQKDGYGCPWFTLGGISITLVPNASESGIAEYPHRAMAMLWLETDNLEAAAQRFSQFGVEVIAPTDGHFMTIADPDGVIIEVWQSELAIAARSHDLPSKM